ncbi:hypothetical protein KIL84_009154 [Mauremys mutica]|uniref:Uncharacterized protein n=1 Tax=Mauremys mutica TaxID=74926 RepID=A0A9D3XI53_9SAUR|nr:hypothetical protein KIL84_009154 [Mauremys mutica]
MFMAGLPVSSASGRAWRGGKRLKPGLNFIRKVQVLIKGHVKRWFSQTQPTNCIESCKKKKAPHAVSWGLALLKKQNGNPITYNLAQNFLPRLGCSEGSSLSAAQPRP